MAGDVKDTTSRTSQFWFSRLGSLLAVLPLGVWTVNHIWDNLAAFAGADAWQEAVTEHRDPATFALTVFIVWAPLLIHAIWGTIRLFSFRPNNVSYPYYGNFKYLLQRLAAVGVLAFIGAHIWLAFLQPRLLEGHAESFIDISREMRFHVPTLVVYVLGTLGVAYHLANGIWSFSMGWGLAVGKKSLKRMDIIAILLFLVLLAASWATIYAMYNAGSMYGPAPTGH
ncbi:MAG: succinate dehydrogenase [Myxococcaceae bacterium]|nr:succinate dehydrogenase [Myxococcaceae bacterium]MCI0673490.1 succinate dehydrogenase [Myxococcaceae bacterium]